MGLRQRLRRNPDAPKPNAVVAAATTISRDQLRTLSSSSGSGAWQEEAWGHWDICGELRFGSNWIGNALSRVRLFAAYVDDNEDEPVAVEEGRPAEIVAALHGGAGGQSQMLKRLGVHLSVPGESFVVTWPAKDKDGNDTGEQAWATLCSDEISEKAGTVSIAVDGKDVELPEETTVIIRVWRPHPRKHWEADSPARGLLPVLHELERLSTRVVAQTESRLAGAGVLFLPDNITFPVEDENGVTRVGTSAAEFIKVLGQAMVTPIGDRESPAAVVPVIAQAPADAIEAIKHITFASDLDAQTPELREAAIRRLALGLDMPPEVLLGLSQGNHWSAWEISENAVTQHIEPLLTVIVDALTTEYFRPALDAERIPDSAKYVIAFDVSELVNRPNRGPDALQLFDRGELNGAALRREHGFSEADGLSAAQSRQKELRDLLGAASLDSDTVNKLLELLGYVQPEQLPAPADTVQVPSTREAVPIAPAPAPRAIPARPEQPQGDAAALLALQVVAQYAANSALEYAGKRLLATDRSYRSRFKGVPHHELHTHIPVSRDGANRVSFMLDGAFKPFDHMPELAPVRAVVEAHVEQLLLTGRHLDRPALYSDVAEAFQP